MCRYLLIVLLLTPVLSHGQLNGVARIDSLKERYGKTIIDTERVNIEYTIAHDYSFIDPQQEYIWAQKVFNESKNLNWLRGIADGKDLLGDYYMRIGSYDTSLVYLQLSAAYYTKANCLKKLSKTEYRVGYDYFYKGKLPQALSYGFISLKIAEENGFWDEENAAYSLIGNIYSQMNDIPKAKEYLLAAANTSINQGNHFNAGTDYENLGTFCDKLKDYAVGEIYYNLALREFTLAHSVSGTINVLECLAISANNTFEYQQALLYANKAMNLTVQSKDTVNLVYILQTFAQISFSIYQDSVHYNLPVRKKYLNDAIHYYQKARLYVNRMGELTSMMLIANNLKTSYENAGNYKAALNEFGAYIEYRDSLISEETKEKINQLSKQREEDLKQRKIEVQALQIKNAALQRIFFIVGLISLIGILVLIFRQNTLRRKANNQLQQLNSQLDMNNRQLDEANKVKSRFFGVLSHDLRSPIARLVSFNNLKRQDPLLLDEIGWQIQQEQIENDAQNLLTVIEDLLLWGKGQMQHFKPQLAWINVTGLFHSIELLFPYSTKICIKFEDTESLKIYTDEHLLKTIMRNLTANAINSFQHEKTGLITWKAWKNDGKFCLSITDNGPGMSEQVRNSLFKEANVTSAQNGLGLPLVFDFVQLLNMNITIESSENKGTTFTLTEKKM